MTAEKLLTIIAEVKAAKARVGDAETKLYVAQQARNVAVHELGKIQKMLDDAIVEVTK